MIATEIVGVREPVEVVGKPSRLVGIDLARAVAMFGMAIAHYVWPDGSGDPIELLARAVSGRAMPLFVLLGGLGVTLLTRRAANPDRALLLRAAMLFPLGVALQEATTVIAIILQSYAVFFVLATVLRRLQSWALLTAAFAVTAIGAWTYQVTAVSMTRWSEPSQIYSDPEAVLGALFIAGSYPVFPVIAFFLVGMVIGRLDLRGDRIAGRLAVGGLLLGLGAVAASFAATGVFGVDGELFDGRTGMFAAGRLFDVGGHSEMPAWVLSATGTSMAALGLSLLIAPRALGLTGPFVALGQLALSFYAFQAVLIRFTPNPLETSLAQELLTVVAIYVGFMIFATLWKLRFNVGPLEWFLRIGSRRRRSPHGGPMPAMA